MPLNTLHNDTELPEVLFNIMKANHPRDIREKVHVTMLTGCLRQPCLQSLHPFEEYASSNYVMLRGSMIHEGIEMMYAKYVYPSFVFDLDGDVQMEVPVKRKFGGVEIVGTVDVLDWGNQKLTDWKCPASLPRFPKVPHIQQLNTYRWMLKGDPHFFLATNSEINYLSVGYLGLKEVREFAVPVWKDWITESWVESRMLPVIDFLEDNHKLPPPEGRTNQDFIGYCKRCSVREICDQEEN